MYEQLTMDVSNVRCTAGTRLRLVRCTVYRGGPPRGWPDLHSHRGAAAQGRSRARQCSSLPPYTASAASVGPQTASTRLCAPAHVHARAPPPSFAHERRGTVLRTLWSPPSRQRQPLRCPSRRRPPLHNSAHLIVRPRARIHRLRTRRGIAQSPASLLKHKHTLGGFSIP